MNERLNEILAKYNETKETAENKQNTIKDLAQQVEEKQNAIIAQMRKELSEFHKYIIFDAKTKVSLKIDNDCLSFYDKNKEPRLYADFHKDGNIILSAWPSGYSHSVEIYNVKSNSWSWYREECKKAITENWDNLLPAIENAVVKNIEDKTQAINDELGKQMNSLSSSLDKLTEVTSPTPVVQHSKTESTLLYNAISLLVDETFEQYEDSQEWLEMIEKELGFTVEEMKEYGITLTVDGGVYNEEELAEEKPSFDKMIASAKQRKQSPEAIHPDKDDREI